MQKVRRTDVYCAVAAAIAMALLPLHVSAAMGQLTSQPKSSTGIQSPGCAGLEVRQCLKRGFEAMGGRDRLAALKTVKLDVIGHTALAEQSYRQAPFITAYERDQQTIDYAGQQFFQKQHQVWPEADLNTADSDSTLIVTPKGGVYRDAQGKDSPCGGGDLDAASETLSLSPERVLLTAEAASDLRYLPDETLRGTTHAVLGFTWKGVPVRVLLNQFNHLPDAVETTQQFRDMWFYWGDVEQRVYFDNWRLVQGVEYPSNQIIERNGLLLSSSQALNIEFDGPVNQKDFTVDAKAAQLSTQSKGFEHPFSNANDKQLAAGIDLFLGPWNTTIVRQADGIVILETPISGIFTDGIFAEAKKRYPGVPIKAVVMTSDSWPHVGGLRYDVAQNLPVYVLDLNQPLLERMLAAPHTIRPDVQASHKSPRWTIVSGKTEIGKEENRMILLPLRGASTERQYLVYFPERRLLYASDTLVLNSDHTLYDPELMREVEAAVDREHLVVDTVYAMHEGPTPWRDVVALVGKSEVAPSTAPPSKDN